MRIYRFAILGILFGLSAISLVRPADATASDAGVLGISQMDVLQLPPDAVTRRVVAQVAEYLAVPATGAIGAEYQNFARAGIARILMSGPGAQMPLDVTAPPMRDRLAALLTLLPEEMNPANPPKQLQSLSFKTREHAATLPNLCTLDELTVRFAPVGNTRGPEAPVKVDLAHVTSWYYFLSPPLAAVLPKVTLPEWRKVDSDCAKLEGHQINAFIATDEEQAIRGYWLQQAMQEQLRSANTTVGVNCDGGQSVECRKKLQDVLSGRFQVVRCQDGDTDCELFSMDQPGLILHITATAGLHPVIAHVLMQTVALTSFHP